MSTQDAIEAVGRFLRSVVVDKLIHCWLSTILNFSAIIPAVSGLPTRIKIYKPVPSPKPDKTTIKPNLIAQVVWATHLTWPVGIPK